jgi:hypothetical protein
MRFRLLLPPFNQSNRGINFGGQMIWVLFITLVTINAYDVSHHQEMYFNEDSCHTAANVIRQHAKELKRIKLVATCFEIEESDQDE